MRKVAGSHFNRLVYKLMAKKVVASALTGEISRD